jgi:hypothetical protein
MNYKQNTNTQQGPKKFGLFYSPLWGVHGMRQTGPSMALPFCAYSNP